MYFNLLTAPVKYMTSVPVCGLCLVGVLLTDSSSKIHDICACVWSKFGWSFTYLSVSKTLTKHRPHTDADVMYFTGAVSK
jgi:hypothetical protein